MRLDECLYWDEHINYLISEINKLIEILYRKKYIFSSYCRQNLFFSLIYSLLVYCVEIYGCAKSKFLRPLIIKCNVVLRILQDKPRTYHVKDLYLNYNTLPVDLLHKFFILKLMHRFVYNRQDLPDAISNLFTANNDVHNYNTRSKYHFNLSNVTVFKSNMISFSGPCLWSKLPLQIRSIPSVHIFNSQCKHELQKEL